jgi:predicted transcriptional regulator
MIFVKSVGGSIIRNVTINISDKKDLEFVQGLENLGMKRAVARVITFLKDQNERYFREIEKATRLSQPEISRAMQTLRENGWLTEHDSQLPRPKVRGLPLRTKSGGVRVADSSC